MFPRLFFLIFYSARRFGITSSRCSKLFHILTLGLKVWIRQIWNTISLSPEISSASHLYSGTVISNPNFEQLKPLSKAARHLDISLRALYRLIAPGSALLS